MLAPGAARTKSTASAVQQLEAGALLGGVLGREQRAPAHAQALDQPPDEHVGRDAVELGGGAAVQLDEALDAFARLGRHLGRLGGGGEAADEVELACAQVGAPPRDLDHARELDLAQLDRRPGQRAHDGGGVLRVDEQAHPGEHVADLGALQKRALRAVRRRGRDSGAGHNSQEYAGALSRLATLTGWT